MKNELLFKQDEMKKMKFKLGDSIKIINNGSHCHNVGTVHTITEVDEIDNAYRAGHGLQNWVTEKEIELFNSHTNKDKKYWNGSFLNVGTDKDQDWVDCDKAQRWKFDIKDLAGNYSIAFWLNGHANILGDLTEEQHNDISFEILDYLDKI